MFVDFSNFTGAFTDAISLVEKNWKNLAVDFTKITLLTYIPLVIGLILYYIVDMLNMSLMMESMAALVLLLLGLIAYFIIDSVSLNVPDNLVKGKRVSVLNQMGSNSAPMSKFVFVIFGLVIVLSMISNIHTIMTVVAIMLAIPVVFLFQFSMYELIVGRKGLLDSFKNSLLLVKSNIPNVIVFDIVFIIIMVIMYIAEQVVLGGLGLLAGLTAAFLSFDALLIIIASILLLVIFIAVLIAGTVISYFVYVLPFYFFWTRISGAVNKSAQPEKKSGKQENVKKPTTQ